MKLNFKFKKLDMTFANNLDSIKVSEYEAIRVKTGDCFLKSYVENLCKKNNKEDRSDIEKHALSLYDEMYKNGYCSSEGYQVIKDTIKSFNDPAIDILDFLEQHKNTFLDLNVDQSEMAKSDPVSFFGQVVQESVNDITQRFGKVLDK